MSSHAITPDNATPTDDPDHCSDGIDTQNADDVEPTLTLDDMLTDAVPDTVRFSYGNTYNKFDAQVKCFSTRECSTVEFCDVVADAKWKKLFSRQSHRMSGIVWQGGWACNDDFRSCSLLCLDNDDGVPTLDQIVAELTGKVVGFCYTTKSHQRTKKGNPECDRYRVVIPFTRPIESLAEYRRVIKVLRAAIFPTFDGQMIAGNWSVAGGSSSSEFFVFGGNKTIDPGKVLSHEADVRLPHNARSPRDFVSLRACQVPYIEKGEIDAYMRREVERRFKKLPADRDRHWRMFMCMVNAFHYRPDMPAVKATLMAWEPFRQWLIDKPNQARCLDQQLFRAYVVYREKSHCPPIEPPTPAIVKCGQLDVPSLPDVLHSTIDEFRTRHGIENTPISDEAFQLLQWAFTNRCETKVIANIPCGAGKSVYLTNHVHTYATPENRFAIVKPTVDDIIAQRDALIDLGTDRGDIALLIGFQERFCRHPVEEEKDWLLMHHPRHSPCIECEHKSACWFDLSRHHAAGCWSRKIVLMTHKMFLRQTSIDPEFTIVVDENLKVWEGMSINSNDIDLLKKLLPDDRHQHFSHLPEDMGTHEDTYCLRYQDRNRLREVIENGGYETSDGGTVQLTAEQAEMVCQYVNFFGNRHPKYVARITPSTVQGDEDDDATPTVRYMWKQSVVSVNGHRDNRIIFLDASATFDNVKWEGFKIVSLHSLQGLTFPNLTLHVAKGHPTKTKLLGDQIIPPIMQSVMSFIENNHVESVFIAANKAPVPAVKVLTDELDGKGIQYQLLYRGSLIGSNAANKCNVAVILTSLFTSVQDYMLSASLLDRKPIPESAVWTANGNLKLHEHFSHDTVDLVYRRQILDEFYQTIMRTSLRNYLGDDEVHVFCVAPNVSFLVALDRLLTDMTVEAVDSGDSEALAIHFAVARQIDPMTTNDNQICKALGVTHTAGKEKAAQLRDQSAMGQEAEILRDIRAAIIVDRYQGLYDVSISDEDLHEQFDEVEEDLKKDDVETIAEP